MYNNNYNNNGQNQSGQNQNGHKNVYLNKFCPWTSSACRTDCACIIWDAQQQAWICQHNDLDLIVYQKQNVDK